MLLILLSIVIIIFGVIIIVFIIQHNNDTMLTRPQLKAEINNALQSSKKLIIFLINLNDFHSVIEAFGYATGNKIILHNKFKIANFAKEHKAKFYYVGFDEYVIFFNNYNLEQTNIANIASSLLDIIAEPYIYEERNIHVTAAVGIAIFPEHANNSDLLLRRVETALLEAKKTGGNNYNFYCSSITEKAIDLTVINTELLAAIKNNELQLLLQPQIELNTNTLIGAEVLVRWNHISKGNISPDIFINIAEKTGLIHQVGEWIIKHACIQAKFLSQELNLDNFKIAINLSSGQFIQGDVVGYIVKIIDEVGIKPANIEIELTESMFINNLEKSLLMLSVLVAMGVKLAIDDFGTGYSSFGRLKQIQWDYIKIDKTFVQELHINKQNYAIVAAIITMAKNLEMQVIAEGVESEQEVVTLKKLGCDIIQGYYTSKPLPITEFIDFARTYKVK